VVSQVWLHKKTEELLDVMQSAISICAYLDSVLLTVETSDESKGFVGNT